MNCSRRGCQMGGLWRSAVDKVFSGSTSSPMYWFKLGLWVCLLLVHYAGRAQTRGGDDIVGTWLTEDGSGEITIYQKRDLFFGKIRGGTSEEEYDVHNPDEARRNDPLVGLVILKNLKFDDRDGEWTGGTVYDSRNGKTYSCNVKLIDRNALKITGYIGFSWIGRSEIWKRID